MTQYEPNDMLTTAECGQVARHNRRTIRNWINSGKLKARKGLSSRGKYLIRYQDLLDALAKEQENPADGTSP